MTANKRLVDTDILIDYLRGVPEAVAYLDSLTEPFYVSTITIAELYAGVREGRERQELDALIALLPVIPVSVVIATNGGLFRRKFGPSHGTGILDAMIAATAIDEGATLITLNRKHFPMVSDLLVPYQKP